MSDSKNYIPSSMAIAGIGGGIYGFYHPSEKSCQKLSQMKPTVVETFEGYRDSFNMAKAQEALDKKALGQKEFDMVKNVFDNLSNVLDKEHFAEEVLNTPFEQRKTSYKTAIKDANKARPKMWKSLFCLTNDFQNKLADLNILDLEKFKGTLSAAKKRCKAMFKELSKGGIKGLAIGLAVGLGFGAFLNSVAKKNS